MRVTVEALRSGLAAYRRRSPAQLRALAEALEAAGAGGPGRRSLDDILELALLTASQLHEQRLEGVTTRMRDALARILDDVETTRGTAAARAAGVAAPAPGAARPDALRRADMQAVAAAIDGLETFEGFVRRSLEESGGDLRRTIGAVVDTGLDPAAIAKSARDRGQDTARRGDELLAAWRRGRTVEEAGPGLPIGRDPLLAATMADLERAVADYRRAPGATADAATAAADRLAAVTARANEHLRAAASGFTWSTTGEALGAAGRAAEQAAAARLVANPALAVSAPPAELMDALQRATPEHRFEGSLREPLERGDVPGLGLEAHLLGGAGIGTARTRPPGLAARLMALFGSWERSHIVGPGFGSELWAGLSLAPRDVNQIAQRLGIERLLLSLHAAGEAPAVTIRARTRSLAVPLTNGSFDTLEVLSSVAYEVRRANGAPIAFRIDIQPNGAWTVTHTIPTGMPGADVPLAGAAP